MEISQPVPSSIEGVCFQALSAQEVKKISVKRITNPMALDPLLHPIPGGLHDLALGAFLDNPCATCNLNVHACPGHCGHIEFPVFLYHCTFINQAFRLLRAQCAFCHKLKMSRVEVNRYWCKLRLIHHGLIEEAQRVDDVGLNRHRYSSANIEAEEESDDAEARSEHIISSRRKYVKQQLKNMRKLFGDSPSSAQAEAVSHARKQILCELHKDMLKASRCMDCNAFSPGFRKNRQITFFRKPLSEKQRQRNIQAGIKAAPNPLTKLVELQRKQEMALKHREHKQRQADDIDEGVADLGDSGRDDEMIDAEIMNEIAGESEEEMQEMQSTVKPQRTSELGLIENESLPQQAKKSGETESAYSAQQYVNANEVHAALTHLFDREQELFTEVYNPLHRENDSTKVSADMFFLKNILVTPNKFRKEQRKGAGEVSESQDNEPYRRILANCDELFLILKEIQGTVEVTRERIRSYDDLQMSWLRLQDTVNWLIDSDTNPSSSARMRDPGGVKQKLEKKEGLFRMNMMGKRVNFAARTVLSPDPNIETNEIGIPPEFARKLTYPEPVTQYNFAALKQAVINGNKYPGAIAIEYENGQITNLSNLSDEQRQAKANLLLSPSHTGVVGTRNKKVHRHLNNGDVVLMNRQPTLHKPSIMAHHAKVLTGVKTFRMHYANCKSYNADFDGDEMNLHFPQNEVARSEARYLADADNQYLSATGGKPLRGLVQDHISMGVWLSCLDAFFSREEYYNFLYSALRPEQLQLANRRILTIDPAICKPKQLWTGKQILTTLLLNIKPERHEGLNLISKCGVPADRWHEGTEEDYLKVYSSEVVTGILDSKQIGASRDGLVHTVHEIYGSEIAGKFIGVLGRLLTKLLNARAFSCGVEDLVMTSEGEAARKEHLKMADTIGLSIVAKHLSLEYTEIDSNDTALGQRLEEVLRDDEKQAALDARTNNQTQSLSSDVTRACLPNGLRKLFPKNQMQTMTTSGAKGSMVNANLISCNLGQQVLEGRRVPIMVSGKTLPAFKPFETSIRAGGFIVDRFLTGVRPQEYFFHTMAGREGLIDTAVKTSRSGYLQRCLIKGMESLRVEYDSSVRDADGTIVQSLYGEDGLDVTKCQKIADFDHIAKNFHSLIAQLDAHRSLHMSRSKEAEKWNEKAAKQANKMGLLAELDPVITRYSPMRYAGSNSEKFFNASRSYEKENPQGLINTKEEMTADGFGRKSFRALINLNYLKAVVQPGEAVGVVAGQSLGEPSTQMTLNTFHLAGHSAKNVTLGIPRLREILMTASVNLKTPTMSLWPNPELSKEAVDHFAKSLSRVSLAQIIDEVHATERLEQGTRSYDIQLNFFSSPEYYEEHALTIPHVGQTLELVFMPLLRKLVKADMKRRASEKSLESATDSDAVLDVGKSSGRVEEEPAQEQAEREGGDSDSEDGGEDDATTAKKRTNLDEGLSYEDPNDEEEAEVAEEEDSSSESEDETYGGSPKSGSAGESEVDQPELSKDHISDGLSNKLEKRTKESAMASTKARTERVLQVSEEVVRFNFDETDGSKCLITLRYPSTAPKSLLVPIVNKAASQSLAGQHIPGVTSCTVMADEQDKKPYLFTQGENLMVMRSYQHFVVPHTMTSNDIGAVLRIYGVEAARETIVRELNGVFEGHSIEVDRRHLTLVADQMTRSGGFKAFSRRGMGDGVSPLQKMSFETTLGFLRDAVQEGETDSLLTPSARIVVGKHGKIGTGMFDLMAPVS